MAEREPIHPGTDKIGGIQLALYFSDRTRDTFTAEAFIDHYEGIAINQRWVDPIKTQNFFFSLRGKAAQWAEALKEHPNFRKDFDWVVSEFLKSYGEIYSEQNQYVMFRDLKFPTKSDPQEFGQKIIKFMKKIKENAPNVVNPDDELNRMVRNYSEEHAPNLNNGQRTDLAEVLREAFRMGAASQATNMTNYVGYTIFRGCTHDEYEEYYRIEKPVTIQDTMAISSFEFRKKGGRPDVNNSTIIPTKTIAQLEEEEEEVQRINSFRGRGRGQSRGQRNFRGNQFRGQNRNQNQTNQRNPSNNQEPKKCNYCKEPNHLISGCLKRIQNNARQGNNQNRNYRTNEVSDQVTTVQTDKDFRA